MKKILVRTGLRRELRKARRAGDLERADLCSQALQDDDVLELVAEGATAQFEYERGVSQLSGNPLDFIRNFVEWFVENRESIMEMVKAILEILALFAILDDGDEE